ncbi:hypothetical protein [Flavobacterium sp.]|jgi:hypothetical protein|uniref:hypothetical protein n=1 Tax=Flavobacterium sp. TaxID=239 RepID=UPI0037BEF4FF
MQLRPHPLRPVSNILHRLAMHLPLRFARPVAKLSARLYYTDKPERPALTLAAQVAACGLLGLAFVAAAVLLRELTR